jgi:hypothetical protein
MQASNTRVSASSGEGLQNLLSFKRLSSAAKDADTIQFLPQFPSSKHRKQISTVKQTWWTFIQFIKN